MKKVREGWSDMERGTDKHGRGRMREEAKEEGIE